jgi:hypothetical protein
VEESAQGGTVKAGGLRIEVAAPQLVSWIYADPSGGEHRSTNCSIARVELSVDGRALRTEYGGAWELGTREAPPGVEGPALPGPVDARVEPVGHRRRRLAHAARERQPLLARQRSRRQRAPHDQLLAPEQLDLRVVARIAARRGLQRRARDVEPRPAQDRLELRPTAAR